MRAGTTTWVTRAVVLAAAVATVALLAVAVSAQAAVDPQESAGQAGTSGKDPKLTSGLTAVVQAASSSGAAAALRAARDAEVEVAGSTITVEALAADGRLAAARAHVRAVGGVVEDEYAGWLVVRLVPAALARLAEGDAIAYVRPEQHAEPQAVAALADGATAAGVAAWHAAGITGTGVKVAIIDVGFAGYQQAQANGDLPANVVPVDGLAGCVAQERHGTAVAQVVHEMAPDAEIHLLCGGTEGLFTQAVDHVIANDIPIFNASLGWKNTSRGDGTGVVGTPDFAVQKARQAGVLPVISAGNDAEKHWMGPFVEGANVNGFTEFAPGDESLDVLLRANERLCVSVKWDAWTAPVDDDYDLFIFDGATQLAASTTLQDGGAGQRPAEDVCFTNAGPDRTASILIHRFQADATARFDLFISRGRFPEIIDEYETTAGSILEPASSPSALSVAAICWQNDALEPYSSRGPTIDDRVEPDLSGQSAVGSFSYGVFSTCGYTLTTGFNGTSAAAPHVAGAAALVKQANPLASPDAIQTLLEQRATELGTPGRDSTFGAGRLTLGPPLSAGPNPNPNPNPNPFPIGGGGPPAQPPAPAPPAVQVAPTAPAFTAPTKRFELRRAFPVAWQGDASAVTYDVEVQRAYYTDLLGPFRPWRTGTRATTANFTGRAGTTYCFRVRSTAASGQVSDWSATSCTAVPVDDVALDAFGAWRNLARHDRFMNTVTQATRRGATLALPDVRATRLSLVATRCQACGTVDVYFRGRHVKTVSLAAPTRQYRALIEVASFPTQRQGTLRIVVTSRGEPVGIEGVAVGY